MFAGHYLESIMPSFADIVGAVFPIDLFPTRHLLHLLPDENQEKKFLSKEECKWKSLW